MPTHHTKVVQAILPTRRTKKKLETLSYLHGLSKSQYFLNLATRGLQLELLAYREKPDFFAIDMLQQGKAVDMEMARAMVAGITKASEELLHMLEAEAPQAGDGITVS